MCCGRMFGWGAKTHHKENLAEPALFKTKGKHAHMAALASAGGGGLLILSQKSGEAHQFAKHEAGAVRKPLWSVRMC